jgi:acetyl-CoA carboxylase biotin carboxylase subunit
MVTGFDLVEWQLRIAAGERLTVRQEDVRLRGSAIECRVYAEDPEQGYMPSPGVIQGYEEPGGPGVRVDGGVYDGWNVPIDYDPLLAKLVVWSETRGRALGRMRRALGEYFVGGITTNLGLFREIMDDEEFREGRLHTGFLDEMHARRGTEPNADGDELIAVVAAALQSRGNDEGVSARVNGSASKWGARVREELYG